MDDEYDADALEEFLISTIGKQKYLKLSDFYHEYDMEFVRPEGDPIGENESEDDEDYQHTCCCEIKVLMREGCRCGGK